MTTQGNSHDGHQDYLRSVQYRDAAKLEARSHLHRAYATAAVPFAAFAADLIAWKPSDSVLECGCGNGRFWETSQLPLDMTLTLTDLSPGMVAEATERARVNGFTEVVGRVCDVQSLPFSGGEFSVVVANHMLYHVPDPDRALAELARVMRDDGVLLAATNGHGHMREIDDAIVEVFGTSSAGSVYEVFGLDSGEARLRKSFASIQWHAFDNDLVADEVEPVVAYGLSFPPGESATDKQREDLRSAIAERFSDGKLRIHTRAGVFVCRAPRRA